MKTYLFTVPAERVTYEGIRHRFVSQGFDAPLVELTEREDGAYFVFKAPEDIIPHLKGWLEDGDVDYTCSLIDEPKDTILHLREWLAAEDEDEDCTCSPTGGSEPLKSIGDVLGHLGHFVGSLDDQRTADIKEYGGSEVDADHVLDAVLLEIQRLRKIHG